jgi:hypothetical protein
VRSEVDTCQPTTRRFPGQVPGRLWASLEWQHEDPHQLQVRHLDGAATVLAQGVSGLSEDAKPADPGGSWPPPSASCPSRPVRTD